MAMATASFSPPNALHIWTSGPDLFVEIPSTSGRSPYIERLPCNTKGITLLLGILGAHRTDTDFLGPIPIPNDLNSNFNLGPGSTEQKALADKALRLAGLLK